MTKDETFEFFRRLAEDNPSPETELEFGNVYQLLVAVVLSAHDMNPLAGALDRIVYLVDGRAVDGSPDEVLTEPVLSGLYRRPVSVRRIDGQVYIAIAEKAGDR